MKYSRISRAEFLLESTSKHSQVPAAQCGPAFRTADASSTGAMFAQLKLAEERSPRRSFALLKPRPLCHFDDVGGLRPFLTLGDFELYLVILLEAFVAFGGNSAIVNKYVGTIGAADEPIAFCVVKPLHRAFQTIHLPPFCARPRGDKERARLKTRQLRCIL